MIMPMSAEPALLWVHADDETDASAPAHAIRIAASTVEAWLADGLPSWLVAMRSRGVAVHCRDGAHAGVHERVVRLREHVAPRTAEALWDFAEAAELPVVATALAMLPPTHTPGFAEIAAIVAQQSAPNAPTLARLLMALEHL
jgi:hypothetical protein